jgi:anti-sigma factor RsiW
MMTSQVDPMLTDKISAYLDGILPEADQAAVERMIATDPVAAAEFEALSRVEAKLAIGFQDLLDRPVPLSLARAIDAAPLPDISNDAGQSRPGAALYGGGLRAIAASLALLGIGATGGMFVTKAFGPEVEVAQAAGWLDYVAAYHGVYAAQGRHLVEVPAAETAHLETWLSETVGVTVRAPDLTANGLVFEGGRLLVANDKPVAQLMYRDAAGQVVAICLMAGGDATAGSGLTPFADRRSGDFDLVSWKSQDTSFVVIGPSLRTDLRQIAETAAIEL